MNRLFTQTATVLFLGTGIAAAAPVALHPVPEDAYRIRVEAPDLADASQVQVQYSGFWQREDYARFRSDRAQAEIVYSAADRYENAALEIPMTFAQARDSFAVNRNAPRRLGTVERVEAADRTIFYQPYRLTDSGWNCVAVKSEWNHVGRDPRNRPARLMFGYICDTTGAVMTAARAETLALSVKTSGAAVKWTGNGPVLANPDVIGNASFPFRFGVHFNDHDSDNRVN